MTNRFFRSWRTGMAAAASLCAAAGASPAFAAGTDAGTTVSNTFTLDYSVGGVPQSQIAPPSTTDFVVDRNVDVTVTNQGPQDVSPGQLNDGGATGADPELVFSVENTGNDNQRYEFIVEQPTSDDFDVASVELTYYVDDGDGAFQPGGADGSGTVIAQNTSLPADVAPDAIIWVVASGDIPGSAGDGQSSDVILVANSLDPATWVVDGATGSAGTETVADADGANDIATTENVLADADGPASSANDDLADGAHSDTGTFNVVSAALAADKTVAVLATTSNAADCANTTTTPSLAPTDTTFYPVPGACIEYVISVTNSGSAVATDVNLVDQLPDDVTWVSSVDAVFTGGTVETTDAGASPITCTAAVTCFVRLTGASLATSATGTLTIRALVE